MQELEFKKYCKNIEKFANSFQSQCEEHSTLSFLLSLDLARLYYLAQEGAEIKESASYLHLLKTIENVKESFCTYRMGFEITLYDEPLLKELKVIANQLIAQKSESFLQSQTNKDKR
ncbi:hypothetical protein B6S12_07565 [Helicobacter valdiviensis]|uniref:Uncharacterized protein n=1 Tax=Helicobacter valdiviensis TaxID=1458358 RepID=A0A2W6NFI2_9HELI|nr:hypothetical protein [Helicobacter valdiviensis]PZT47710.1 hypothetical protein B6S12_07565 [Helicobacter valdiviensis]